MGEKGPCRFLLRARGVAGHASVPGLGDNALLKLAPALERLREQPPLEPTPEGVAFVAALSGEEIDPHDREALEAAVERLREAAPEVTAYLAEPMLRVTLVPTQASASTKENVIPSACRGPDRLPGAAGNGPCRGARARPGRAGRGRRGTRDRVHREVVGNRSPADSPLARRSRNGLPRPTRAPP